MGSFSIRCYILFSAKDDCDTYCVLCITSVDLICSISLSRIVDTSEVIGVKETGK